MELVHVLEASFGGTALVLCMHVNSWWGSVEACVNGMLEVKLGRGIPLAACSVASYTQRRRSNGLKEGS